MTRAGLGRLTLLALLCAPLWAQTSTPIACGQTVRAILESGATHRYQASLAAGDVVTIRVVTREFRPLIELVDPNGTALEETERRVTRRVTREGTYFLRIRAAPGGSLGGLYHLVWQRVNAPCNAVSLGCGRLYRTTMESEGELDAYTFQASAGDTVSVKPVLQNLLFFPFVEIYSPSGALLDEWLYEQSVRLKESGLHTILVRWQTGAVPASYGIVWQRLNNPCSNIELTCGSPNVAPLSVAGESDAYSFRVEAGDILTIRAVPVSGRVAPYLELYYADDGFKLGEELFRLDKVATRTGQMTLVVSDGTQGRTGGYVVVWQRINNPCGAAAILCGQRTPRTFQSGVDMAVFTLLGGAGDTVTFRADRRSGAVTPYLELYEQTSESRAPGAPPEATVLAEGYAAVSVRLVRSVPLTLLVFDDSGRGAGELSVLYNRTNAPCQIRDTTNPTVSLLSPQGGETVVGGQTLPIRWVSRDDTVVSSHEVRLSTDGGGTYSTILAPSLSGEIFSYSWNVPATLAAARARVRVIARDAVGNQSQADSRDFTIRALDVPQPRLVSYRYDKLNRLVGIIYEDGTRVSFSYDAAGNRTRVVVSGPGAEPARPLPPRSRQGEGTP